MSCRYRPLAVRLEVSVPSTSVRGRSSRWGVRERLLHGIAADGDLHRCAQERRPPDPSRSIGAASGDASMRASGERKPSPPPGSWRSAVLMAVLFDGTRELDAGMAAALVVAYALVRQVRFDIGAGFAVPTQLVFVPMLFLLPADAAAPARRCRHLPRLGGRHPGAARAPRAGARRAWPTAGSRSGPPCSSPSEASRSRPWPCACWPSRLSSWPTSPPPRAASGCAPRSRRSLQARVIGEIAVVDGLLWPIGLLAALAAANEAAAPLLVLPHGRPARAARPRPHDPSCAGPQPDRAAGAGDPSDGPDVRVRAGSGRHARAGDRCRDRRHRGVQRTRDARRGRGRVPPVGDRHRRRPRSGSCATRSWRRSTPAGPVEVPASAPTAMAIPLSVPAGDGGEKTIVLSVARPDRPSPRTSAGGSRSWAGTPRCPSRTWRGTSASRARRRRTS